MRNLARCSRGSVGFATVIALVPLIGFVALGAEAGSWYVTKQNAQNAADAAAYSGGLSLACSLSTGTDCDTTQDYIYRGKQIAAQNKFCNSSGDPVYPGSTCGTAQADTTQTVSISRGTYSSGAWTSSSSGLYVLATVAQQQPGYLAKILGLSTINIRASAVVQIKNPQPVCAFGLGPGSDALTIGGSSAITGSGCAMMSNTNVKYNGTPTFSGSGWGVNAVDGCKASSGHCALTGASYNYNTLPAPNPLSVLNSESFNTMPNVSGNANPTSPLCSSSVLQPPAPTGAKNCYWVSTNTAGTAYKKLTLNSSDYAAFAPPASGTGTYYFNGDLSVNAGATVNFAPGTYYFNGNFGGGGTIKFAAGTYFFNGSAITLSGTVTGTGVTLVLLGNSSLTITGTVNLSAPTTNSFSSDLNGILIDDQAPSGSSNNVTINGGGNVTLGGAMYFPNVAVAYGGTTQNANTACTEVVAASLSISGNAYLSSSGCTSNTLGKTKVIAIVR